jgi:hypothetical protein
VPLCLGSTICQYRGCEAFSAASASAISGVDPICGVPMLSIPKRVMAFMQQFQGGSEKLLRYVGLLPD